MAFRSQACSCGMGVAYNLSAPCSAPTYCSMAPSPMAPSVEMIQLMLFELTVTERDWKFLSCQM